jgi:hypothetical protein
MTEHKKCSKCLLVKPTCDFYKNKKSKDGFRSNCIQCINEYKKLNEDKIKEQTKKYNKKRTDKKREWAHQNKEKVTESRKKWLENNKESRLIYLQKYNKEYYEKNKEYRSEYSRQKAREYRRYKPLYRIKNNLRKRIGRFLKNKSVSTEKLLGITYDEFIVYLENKFTEGMTLEKVGKEIHIDHITPLSSAKTEEDLIKLCHYTNLQPLWAKDNLAKSNKLDYLS